MSRLTGNDAKGLMEAYSAVYTPQQELTEEQIWEEVETWVNSLLEEGYDLSEYTWEEMYESYLSEQQLSIGPGGFNVGGKPFKPAGQKPLGPISPVFQQKPSPRGVSIGPGGFNVAGKPADTRVSPIFGLPQGSRLDRPAGASNRPAPAAARPAAPAARPATAPAAARPAAPAARPAAAAAAPAKPAGPAIGKLGSTSFERRTPTSAELKAAQAARAGGAGPEQALQAAKAAGTAAKIQAAGSEYGKKAFSSTLSPSNVASQASAPKPTPVAPKATTLGSRKPGSRFENLDLFDVIKGHLLDEGYADTEESALAIMANMSEEWRSTILEKEGDGKPMDSIEKSPGDPGFNAPPPAERKKFPKLTPPPEAK